MITCMNAQVDMFQITEYFNVWNKIQFSNKNAILI